MTETTIGIDTDTLRPFLEFKAEGLSVTLSLTPRRLAALFCELDDDQQAKFFVEAAKIAETWPNPNLAAVSQWHNIGSHLRTCECSTPEARLMIETIFEGIKSPSD